MSDTKILRKHQRRTISLDLKTKNRLDLLRSEYGKHVGRTYTINDFINMALDKFEMIVRPKVERL